MQEADNRELKLFGGVFSAGLVIFFGLLLPWLFDRAFPLWPWITAVIISLIGITRPGVLLPVYRVWMKIGHVLGMVNSTILLCIVYYLIIFPIGFSMKLLGRQPLANKLDVEKNTYRKFINRSHAKDNFERPY